MRRDFYGKMILSDNERHQALQRTNFYCNDSGVIDKDYYNFLLNYENAVENYEDYDIYNLPDKSVPGTVFYDKQDHYAPFIPMQITPTICNPDKNTPSDISHMAEKATKDDKEMVRHRWDELKNGDDNKFYKPAKMKEIRKEERKKREWNIFTTIKNGIGKVFRTLFMEEVEGNYEK